MNNKFVDDINVDLKKEKLINYYNGWMGCDKTLLVEYET